MDKVELLNKRIAELEASEKELFHRVTELSDFIENATIPLHWVNGSGIIIWVNKAELDMLGYPMEEVLNQHISKFHADKDVIEDILTRLIHKETLINYPAELLCKNGTIKPVLINSNVYWKDGEFVHTRCFTRDVSELKAKDLSQKKLIESLQNRIRELEHQIKQVASN